MTTNIAKTAIVYDGVQLGEDSNVDEFVLLGVTPRGHAPGEVQTEIGAGATIRSHSVVYAGNKIGAHFQTGHGVMIREDNSIGDNVSIGTHSIVEHHVVLGNGVRIHSNAFVPEYSIVEDGAWIGPNVVFTNARYPLGADAKKLLKGPRILQGAKLGANSTLLPGVTVGRNSLVGAGSVVVEDVPDNKVVVGNPARVVRDVSDIPAYAVNEVLGHNGKE